MSKKFPCPNGVEDDCGYPACAHATQCERAAKETTSSPRCSTLLCGGKPAWKRNTRPNWITDSTEYKCQTCYERNRHWSDDFNPKWMQFVKIENTETNL